ncbi:hypothetical protein VTO42DRAFT_5461 [Malbranchea cinnamomea]
MADHRTSTLQYGHLGTASYLPDVQCWDFPRGFQRDRALTFLGGVRICSPPNSGDNSSLPSPKYTPTSRNVDSLLDTHPDLAPSVQVIGQSETSSRAITEAVSQFDPLVSSRFALGNASTIDENRLGDRLVSIAVLNSSDSPTSLQLLPFDCDSLEWPPGSGNSVEVPVIDNRGGTRWTRKGTPIQQVVASDAFDEKSVFVAVRFLLSTIILQPLYHRSLASGVEPLHEEQSNVLDANPLIEISSHLTGGHPHADVTFNPWYQRQLAIVDIYGHWSIWDLQGRQPHKGYWSVGRGPCGSLASSLENDTLLKGKPKDNYDGWAMILWVGNVHQLLVCDRRTVILFRTDTNPPKCHQVDLQFERRSEWVLDVKRSKYNPAHVFVLTSTRVLWISVASGDYFNDQEVSKATILLSWRHFRDLEDASLKLAPFFIQNVIYIALYSQLNSFSQLFRFRMTTDEAPMPTSISDPSILPLPAGASGTNRLGHEIDSMIFSSMTFKVIEQTATPDPSNDSETLRLVKFMGLTNDSRLVETLYYARTENVDDYGEFVVTDSISPSIGNRPVSILSSTRANDDDFIVDDGCDPVVASRQVSTFKPAKRSRHDEQWKDQHASIYSAVEDFVMRSSFQFQPQSFGDWLAQLPTVFQKFMQGNVSTMPMTMLDVVKEVPTIDDIDENARQLEIAIKYLFDPDGNNRPQYLLGYLPIPWSSTSSLSPTYHPSTFSNLGISDLYESLISDWLSSLSEEVPGKIRVYKERLIRRIVIELTLARVSFLCRDWDQEKRLESSQQENAPAGSTSATAFPTRIRSSDTLPPPLDGIASHATALTLPSSQPSSHAMAEEGLSAYSTLRRYTTLNPQSAIPKRVAMTISHWKVGCNPSNYDWQNTVRTLQEGEKESQASERRRKRAERRRKLPLERESQWPEASSSVDPSVRIGGSQPLALNSSSQAKYMLSSEITPDDGFPMSQIVRGTFGSREASKKSTVKERKKKRAAGF